MIRSKISKLIILVIIAGLLVTALACTQPSPTTSAPAPATTTTSKAPVPSTSSAIPVPPTTTSAIPIPPTTTSAIPTPPTTSATKTTAAPPPQQQQVYNLRLQSFVVKGTGDFNNIQRWVDNMILASGGRLKITHTGSGTLVPDAEILSAVGKGTIDMGLSVGMYYAGTVPAANIEFCYPGMVKDMRECFFYRQFGFLDVLREMYKEMGVRFIDLTMDYGFDIMSKKPINRLADVKGVKIRTGGGMGEVLAKAGASIVTVPTTEVYTAFSTGVVDAALYGNIYSAKQIGLLETAKACVLGVMSQKFGGNYLMNQKVWESLPDDLKEIISVETERTAETLMIPAQIEMFKVREEFKAKGGTIITWPDEDQATMAKYSIELMNQLAAKDPKWVPQLIKIVQDIIALRGVTH